jgi:hypothetical protein
LYILPNDVIVEVRQFLREVNPILPAGLKVEVTEVLRDPSFIHLPDDVIVEVRQVMSEVNLSARLPVPPVNTPIQHAAKPKKNKKNQRCVFTENSTRQHFKISMMLIRYAEVWWDLVYRIRMQKFIYNRERHMLFNYLVSNEN